MKKLYAYIQSGLGNRLFIIASVMGMAKKYGREFAIFGHDNNRYRDYQWLYERLPMRKEDPSCMDSGTAERICKEIDTQIIWDDRETDFSYRPFTFDENRDTCLFGFFINSDYFKDIEWNIRWLFREPDHVVEYLDNFFLLNSIKNMVAIHVRIGDYRQSYNHLIPLHNYYDKCVKMAQERFGDNIQFVIVCEDKNEVIQCYPNLTSLPNVTFFPSDPQYAEYDLYFMSRVHGVICANSTFSWWGAWMNTHNDKWICMPSQWLRDRTIVPTIEESHTVSIY